MIFNEKLDKSLDVLINYFDDDDLWQAQANGVNILDTLCGIRIFMEDNDMVPVIRCVDCAHCTAKNGAGFWHCSNWDMDIYDGITKASEFYCADAVRRDG